jgi:nicotinamide riboside kinase
MQISISTMTYKKDIRETKTGIGVDIGFYTDLPRYTNVKEKFKDTILDVHHSFRIGFVGANSTGKTTLSKLVSEKYCVPILHETASVVVGELGMRGHSETTCNTQLAIYFGQLWAELAFDSFVSDRTLLDTVAHTEPAYEREFESGDTGSRYVLNSLEHAMAEHIKKTYDVIFYLPIEFVPVDDGFRDTDISFQKLLDSKIASLIERFKIDVVTLKGSVSQRLTLISRVLKDFSM